MFFVHVLCVVENYAAELVIVRMCWCWQTTGKVPLAFLAEDTKLRAYETVVMALTDASPDSELQFRQGQYIIATMDDENPGSTRDDRMGKAHGRLPDGSQGMFDKKCVVVVDA